MTNHVKAMMRTHTTSRGTVALVAMALMLAGCVSPTPYQPRDNGQGYTEQKLENDRYRVTFAGNSETSRETVENYLLYRAAEITLRESKDYFVVVTREGETHTRVTSPEVGGLFGTGWGPYGNSTFTGLSVGSGTRTTEYYAQADIVLHSGERPDDDTRAYAARALIENLEPVIVRPNDG